MAAPKKPVTVKQGRTVPVRVVKTATPRPVAPIPASTPVPVAVPAPKKTTAAPQGKQAQPKSVSDRRTLMWAGVVIVTGIILVLWVGFMKRDLTSSSNSNDSFFTKIFYDVKNVFTSFHLPATNSGNANDRALNDLRNRTFPAVNTSGTFVTGNVNQNLNTNATNSSTNTNSLTNTVTP